MFSIISTTGYFKYTGRDSYAKPLEQLPSASSYTTGSHDKSYFEAYFCKFDAVYTYDEKNKPKYSLQTIAEEKEVNCEGNTSGEVWCAIIDQIINKGSGAKKLDIVEDKEVAAVKRYAIPVFDSAAMRADIHVLLPNSQLISKDTGGTGVLQCEIHSSPFKKVIIGGLG